VTARDFEMVASIVHLLCRSMDHEDAEANIDLVAERLKETNIRFDADRFKEACRFPKERLLQALAS
jgi:hypothetical protein